MVKCRCKVKLVKYKADKSGYPGVMNAGAVQSILSSKASAVCSAANGSAQQPGSAYVVEDHQGVLAKGRFVYTDNGEAAVDEFRHKTLTKAAHSAGGR